MKTLWIALTVLCLAAAATAQDAKVTPLMAKDLAGIAGKEGTMVTVEYPPGGKSAEHRHNAHTFVYVLEGSIVMQVKGGRGSHARDPDTPSTNRRTTSTPFREMPAPPSRPSSWCSSLRRRALRLQCRRSKLLHHIRHDLERPQAFRMIVQIRHEDQLVSLRLLQ
jgi:hypothetical protein